MDVFFGDESIQKGARSGMGKLIAFGGVFVEEQNLRTLASAIDAIAKNYGIPAGTELKWSPSKKNWIRDNLVGSARKTCYAEVLDVAKRHDARALVSIWDTGRTTLDGADAFEKCLDMVWERVEMHLQTMDREV